MSIFEKISNYIAAYQKYAMANPSVIPLTSQEKEELKELVKPYLITQVTIDKKNEDEEIEPDSICGIDIVIHEDAENLRDI